MTTENNQFEFDGRKFVLVPTGRHICEDCAFDVPESEDATIDYPCVVNGAALKCCSGQSHFKEVQE